MIRWAKMKSGKKYWSDGTPVAGQQFEYGFDDIGNRTSTKAGGDENGANLRPENYQANFLNQYTSRSVTGAVDIVGAALATNTVKVNSQVAYRKGEYFRKEILTNNSSAPVWLGITVSATNETTITGSKFFPQTPESFVYDSDGNLTQDGRWNYTWDAENRLIALESPYTFPDDKRLRLEFQYDHQWRRTQKIVSTWDSGTWSWVPQSTNRFIYDGWNLIAVLDPQSTVLQSFTWGIDLSGTLQGAGGVGGLLSMRVHSGANAGTYFYCYDGNGNVTALVKSDGALAAQYEYGPFGEVIRSTGPLAPPNSFRFSTKYQDEESGLHYYGYRHYNSNTGRWISLDPIHEAGGQNLYGCLQNDPLGRIDELGLYPGRFGHGKAMPPNDSVLLIARLQAEADSEFDQVVDGFSSNPEIPYSIRTLSKARNYWRLNYIIPVQMSKNPKGLNTDSGNRFVYTCKFGWIDMGHFFRNANAAYKLWTPVVATVAWFIEAGQAFVDSDSAWAPEDLVSNREGRRFGNTLEQKDRRIKYYSGPGMIPPAAFANIYREWDSFLRRSGAVQWTPEVVRLIKRDALSYGAMPFRELPRCGFACEGVYWQKQRRLWRCVCNGDRPKAGLAY